MHSTITFKSSLNQSMNVTSKTARSSSATSPDRKEQSAPASPFSIQSPLRRTLYLLATTKGFIADHSKWLVDDASNFYTTKYEEALSYLSYEAAALRAQAIVHLDPSVTVTPLEVFCPPGQYPYGWLKE